MKTNKYVKILLDNGLNVKTISKLNESQMRVLVERFKKLESKEQVTPITQPAKTGFKIQGSGNLPKTDKGYSLSKNPDGSMDAFPMTEDDTLNIVTDPAATADGMPTTEGETNERFKSTAQQRFFWKKCDNSKDKKSKWCQLADEFQKDTKNKRLPKKLHPEKTVKVKTEGYEKYLEDSIVDMVDRYINPAMTKSQLINTLNEKVNKSESFMLKKPKRNSMFSKEEGKEMKTMKRPIGKLSSIGEGTKTAPARPDTDTDKKEKGKDRDKKTPYGPKYNPKPKAFKGEYKENEIAPARPDTDTDKKEKGKDRDKKTPYGPKYNPKPKAGKTSLPNFLKWDKLRVNLK